MAGRTLCPGRPGSDGNHSCAPNASSSCRSARPAAQRSAARVWGRKARARLGTCSMRKNTSPPRGSQSGWSGRPERSIQLRSAREVSASAQAARRPREIVTPSSLLERERTGARGRAA
jgi:hypothetical protein